MPDLNRVIICHTLVHMREAFAAAQELHKELVIQTATGALRFAGAEYLLATFRKAQSMFPEVAAVLVLQCDDAAADSIHAMRSGHTHIRTSAPEPTRAKLLSIAQQLDIVVAEGEAKALDLLYAYNHGKACRDWLAGI